LEIAEDLLDKLETMRAAAPETGERILGLRARQCYSLHAGRYRAATWYDRAQDMVWLIAAGVHRVGSPEDFYVVVTRLEQAGQLYPTEADYAALAASERRKQLEREALDLRHLRDQALQSPRVTRLSYTSDAGLYAEVWAEVLPDLALVALRVRIARLSGDYLSAPEWAIVLRGPLGPDAVEKPDPDGSRLFRYFEEYVAGES